MLAAILGWLMVQTVPSGAQFGGSRTPYSLQVLVEDLADAEVASAVAGVRTAVRELERRFRLELSVRVDAWGQWNPLAQGQPADGYFVIAEGPLGESRLTALEAARERSRQESSAVGRVAGAQRASPVAVMGPPETYLEALVSADLDYEVLAGQLGALVASQLRLYEHDVAMVVPEFGPMADAGWRQRVEAALRQRRPRVQISTFTTGAEVLSAQATLAEIVRQDARRQLDLVVLLSNASVRSYEGFPWTPSDYQVVAVSSELVALHHLRKGAINAVLAPDRHSLAKQLTTRLIEQIYLGRSESVIESPPWIVVNRENVEAISQNWSAWLQ